jgi:small nuclear ribonucleoprotein E
MTRLISTKGFDEFMNLVVDEAVEVRLATKSEEEKRRHLGRMYSSPI